VLSSYQARSIARPGSVPEWADLVARIVVLVEQLYRDARILTGKRQQMRESPPSSTMFREAQRIYGEIDRRAIKHCQDLAHVLLATGMTREHLDGHFARCGMENNLLPDYKIALLYSKLMGIPFREERPLPPHPADGPNAPPRYMAEDRCYHWASEVNPGDLDDFYWTMRTLQEHLPSLAVKFRYFASRRSLTSLAA
jgi:hypothetical protein